MASQERHNCRGSFRTLVVAVLVWIAVPCATSFNHAAFSRFHPTNSGRYRDRVRRLPNLYASVSEDSTLSSSEMDEMDDKELLKSVKKAQLVSLCKSLSLSSEGTKGELLKRLRQYARDQSKAIQEQQRARIVRVEEGIDNPNGREKFELVKNKGHEEDDDDDFDEEELFFFLPDSLLPQFSDEAFGGNDLSLWDGDSKEEEEETPPVVLEGLSATELPKEPTTSSPSSSSTPKPYITTSQVVAPPPPLHLEPNEKGERVVTVYSSSDMNDLTGVAAAQPGQAARSSTDAMMTAPTTSSTSSSVDEQPWQRPKQMQSSKEEDRIKAKIRELVETLLLTSGAPAFREYDDDLAAGGLSTNLHVPDEFVGFNPTLVPTDIWNQYGVYFRTQQGMTLLREVLREIEIYAIGHDGIHGDDPDKGGGHYREVNKVRAFLEGYGRTEIRKSARDTLTMLLDKLAGEGLEGLDLTLASMTRNGQSSQDSLTGAELNDSLLQYLNDVIRQQELKVERYKASQPPPESLLQQASNDDDPVMDNDPLHNLWKVEQIDHPPKNHHESARIENTLDPKDPEVKRVLKEEYTKMTKKLRDGPTQRTSIPNSATEQLLLLLTLLRERIKAEAAFVPDERGRNLRLLAYCLKCSNDQDRQNLITSQLGTAIDRYDSFIELVTSSIEYSESTSSELQPAKSRDKSPILNLPVLKQVLELTRTIREQQAWKASGAISSDYHP